MMQTAALRNYCQIDCIFLDGPYKAQGPPDEGVTRVYPDMEYFEWFVPERREETVEASLRCVDSFTCDASPVCPINTITSRSQP